MPFPYVAAALGAGYLIQGYGAYRSGLDRGALLRANARELRKSAKLREAAGKEEARRVAEIGAINEGAILNETRAAGLSVYGSPLEAYAQQVHADVLDATSRITQAKLEADAMRKQASMMSREASSAEFGGKLSGIASLFLGAGFAGQSYQDQRMREDQLRQQQMGGGGLSSAPSPLISYGGYS